MQSKNGYIPAGAVGEAEVEAFTGRLREHLRGLLPANFEGFGDAVSKAVDKMVAPSAREIYRPPDMVLGLAAFEAGLIGQKIRRYQFIERYKFFADLPDPEMGMAFGEHMYSVRNAELYGVLERGEAIIRFIASMAVDLGVGDAKAPGRYAEGYRNEFRYRLRERHRMTHAHERPSLASRILQLGDIKSDEHKAMLEAIFGDILGTLDSAFSLIQEAQPEDKRAPQPRDRDAFQRWYLERVDEEAAAMWRIFAQALATATGLPDPADETA